MELFGCINFATDKKFLVYSNHLEAKALLSGI